MHRQLKAAYPDVNAIEFPPRSLFGTTNARELETRRQQIQAYFKDLVALLRRLPQCPLSRAVTKDVLLSVVPLLKEDAIIMEELDASFSVD